MRYSVFFKKAGGEKTCVYNTMSPDLMLALMNPKVHLAADSAGTFECSLNPNSPAMSESILERMATKVMIEEYEDHVPNEYATGSAEEIAAHEANKEKVIFYGRVLSIGEDFYNTPSLYCEGALSFLNDTVIMPKIIAKENPVDTPARTKYGKYFTPAQALQQLLGEHNAAVTKGGSEVGIRFNTDTDKMIVTMKDDLFSGEKNDGSGEQIENFKITTYTNTLEVLNNLKKTYGGRFRVRYLKPTPADKATFGEQMAIPVLDWLADYDNTKQGTDMSSIGTYIEFGKNLLDLTKKRDGANIVNSLFLTGKKIVSADGELIGDEIDIAPMAYPWMLKINYVYNMQHSKPEHWEHEYYKYYTLSGTSYIPVPYAGDDATAPVFTDNTYYKKEEDQTHPVSVVTSNPTLDQTYGENVLDLRFFSHVKDGGIFRSPNNIDEINANGVNDLDISHAYKIGDGLYAWDPWTQTRTNLLNDTQGNPLGNRIKEEDIKNGDVVRIRQTNDMSRALIPAEAITHHTISSKGMAWVHGVYINNVGGDEQISYAQNMHEYSSTGYWDSGQASGTTSGLDYGSLEVYAGEHLYLSSFYAQGSGGSEQRPVGVISSKNHLKTNGCIILNMSTGTTGGTTNKFTDITIPTPKEDNTKIYLNLSAKDNSSNVDQVRPVTRAELGMQLWRRRKVNYDEYVTIWGCDMWQHQKWFLDTEKYKDQNDKEKTRTVLRRLNPVIQNYDGTPEDEKWFVYPVIDKANGWIEVSYPGVGVFPEDPAVYPYDSQGTYVDNNDTYLKVYFIAQNNGYVWRWNITKHQYDCYSPLAVRGYKVNSYAVEDPVSIAKYGRIEKIVNYSNCVNPDTLRDLGAKALFEAKLEGIELNVTALDLSLIDNNVQSPDVLDMIAIKSDPHKVDIVLPLSERDIPLNDPAQQQYSIGYTGSQKISKTYSWIRK